MNERIHYRPTTAHAARCCARRDAHREWRDTVRLERGVDDLYSDGPAAAVDAADARGILAGDEFLAHFVGEYIRTIDSLAWRARQ